MDTTLKKITRKRKALDDGEIESNSSKKNKKIDYKSTTKVTKSRTAKSTSKMKQTTITDDVDGCIESDSGKKNKNIDDKSTTKVTKSRTVKSTSKIKKSSVSDDLDGCVIDSIENADNAIVMPDMWNEAEVLSQMAKVSQNVAQNFIGLLTEGCTLPFIARYRKTAVEQMMPDR